MNYKHNFLERGLDVEVEPKQCVQEGRTTETRNRCLIQYKVRLPISLCVMNKMFEEVDDMTPQGIP